MRRGVGLGEQNRLLGEQPRVRVLQGADGVERTRLDLVLIPLLVGRADHVEQGAHEMLDLGIHKCLSVQRHHVAARARGEEDHVGAVHFAVVEVEALAPVMTLLSSWLLAGC